MLNRVYKKYTTRKQVRILGLYVGMWIAFIAMIVVNFLSNSLPINGQTTAEISNRLEVLFTPAGYVFSIWGLIYLLVLVWLIMQYKHIKNNNFVSQIGVLFIISCVFNIAWLFTWHYEQFALSILFMLLLLGTLILLYLKYPNTAQGFSERFPFSYYLAWITVATIANISYVLKDFGVDFGISEAVGSLVLVAAAVVIGYLAVKISKDIYFVVVVVWALIGIVVETSNATMETGTIVMTIILVIAALAQFIMNKKAQRA